MWKQLKEIFSGATEERDTFDYSSLNFPFETRVVPGSEALSERELAAAEGICPVIMGSGDDVRLLQEQLELDPVSMEEVLAEAETCDLERWMAELLEQDGDYYQFNGDWPTQPVQPTGMILHLDLFTSRPKSRIIIGLVPVRESWKIPAIFGYGDWNACPATHIHVARHHVWHQKYQSEIIGISGDIIQCSVGRRPATREEALQLAREQYLYCDDIVSQGVGSVEALAATLLESDYWYFWWD